MPDEIEVPMDDVREKIDETHRERFQKRRHSEEPAKAEEHEGGWMRFVGVATAILAVIAAIGALQSGLLVNEALIQKNEQIGLLTQASDQWNYYQAEGLKSLLYKTAAQALPPSSPVAQDDIKQGKHYKEKQTELQAEAQRLASEAETRSKAADRFLDRHHVFAYCVSLCQIAIALSAVAALTKRAHIWSLGLCAGAGGLLFLLYGFLHP